MGTPKEVLSRCVEVYNSRDRATWMGLCTLDAMINRKLAGVAGWVWHYDVLCEAFPDSRFEITSSAEEGEFLGYEVAFAGTQTGHLRTALSEVDATGKRVEVDYAGFIRVVDGKVASLNVYGLDCALWQQLGVGVRRERGEIERELSRVTEDRDGWKLHAGHLHDELVALVKDRGLFRELNEMHVVAELRAAERREATLRDQVEELERQLAERDHEQGS